MTRKRNHWRSRSAKAAHDASPILSVLPRAEPKVGLLVTDELNRALEQCVETVRRIAKDCRAKNRKFRDIEFDLDNDRDLCLNGLVRDLTLNVTAASRVTDIFHKPQFFINGAGSNDIVQGGLGDCYFVSALATASTSKNLIDKFCVARDEKVGVYGFVFFKNGSWVNVIIDDLLFVNVPKFEELNSAEQQLFHGDKKQFNRTARKGGKYLCFARSGTENETWVPLVEKAYAKLHGDYASLIGGRAAEALEDLTGGVSSTISMKDILDIDKFWEEELLRVNIDRLFSASLGELDTSRSGRIFVPVEGLVGGHSYSILKAVEVGAKRFVILRNPWGHTEWKGPWSDGSKEWTSEWLARLPEIGHVFGEDGQFIMEYGDFLERFEDIDKTIMFDASWKMSMEWLRVPTRPPPSAWSFGDVSFNFTISGPTQAVIVLSKLDERYFKGLDGCYNWNLQFHLYKIGEEDTTLVAESEQAIWGFRSVNTEANLVPGDYAVHVRMEGLDKGDEPDTDDFNKRKWARVLTERSQARLAASNYDPTAEKENFPIPIKDLVDREKLIAEERKKRLREVAPPTPTDGEGPNDVVKPNNKAMKTCDVCGGTSAEPKEPTIEDEVSSHDEKEDNEEIKEKKKEESQKDKNQLEKEEKQKESEGSDSSDESKDKEGNHKEGSKDTPSSVKDASSGGQSDSKDTETTKKSDVFIGLRIYTKGGERIPIIGTIREDADKLFAAATANPPPMTPNAH